VGIAQNTAGRESGLQISEIGPNSGEPEAVRPRTRAMEAIDCTKSPRPYGLRLTWIHVGNAASWLHNPHVHPCIFPKLALPRDPDFLYTFRQVAQWDIALLG